VAFAYVGLRDPRDHRVTLLLYTIKAPPTSGWARNRAVSKRESDKRSSNPIPCRKACRGWPICSMSCKRTGGAGMSTRTARATRLGRGPIDLAIDIRAVALVVSPAAGPGQDCCAATPRGARL